MRRAPLFFALIATAIALWLVTTKLAMSPDVGDLLPDAGEGQSLRQYARAFGGGDVAMVLVRGAEPERVRAATERAAALLRDDESVRAAIDRIDVPRASDPSQAWPMSPPRARAAIREALTPEGMRKRLRETRALLLTPGAGAVADALRDDPLRLAQIPFEQRTQLASGASAAPTGSLTPNASGAFVADAGRARLILIAPKGQALRGVDARAFVKEVEETLSRVRSSEGGITFELTGGHAIAAASERAIRRDLVVSGVLSTLLAALAFALTFRRLRALVAVMPPLAIGTLWTAAAATLALDHLSAITVGFVAVVVGVGVDTGVHVYAALLEARRRGLAPAEAAHAARAATWRPTMVAAATAAFAFGALGLSQIPALRQFGFLCAAGELLTAVAILAVTPWLGALLERGDPPARRTPRWVTLLGSAARHHAAPAVLAMACFVPVYVLFTLGLPTSMGSFVGIRAASIAPVVTQQTIQELFGGGSGQWVVLLDSTGEQDARRRADRVFEALDVVQEHTNGFDGLARFAPSEETQRSRMKERDAFDMAGRAETLRTALVAEGFAAEPFAPAIRALASPSQEVHDLLARDGDFSGLLRARFLARDGDHTVAAVFVRPKPGQEARVEAAIRGADAAAKITGYARLETALASGLRHDLPRVVGVAALLVAATMALGLRRWRDIGLGLGVLALEVAWVVACVRWWGLPIHAYNAFVIPVLLGITVDEAMFLIFRARSVDDGGMEAALRHEGPNVLATGVTTAAGFAGLLACTFDGLRDMGRLGVLGVLIGLFAALWVVPVGLSRRDRAKHG